MTSALSGQVQRRAGCSCGCSGCSSARLSAGEFLVIGADNRVAVRRTVLAPFRYICNLELSGWSRGSGTLIGPRTVLTAGHCVIDRRTGRFRNFAALRVIPGRNGAFEPLPTTRATSAQLFPGFRPSTSTDLALLYLADPIGNTVGFWTQNYMRRLFDRFGTSMSAHLPMPAGQLRVNLSGYPKDLPAEPRFHCRSGGVCRSSPTKAPRNRYICGTTQYKSFDRTVQPARAGMLSYLNSTCNGHSGSPVWVRRHPSMGGRVMIGVHVRGDTAANSAVRFTDAHLRWIAAGIR